MKTTCTIYVFFALCLTIFPGPCIGSPSSEAPIPILPSSEELTPGVVAVEPTESPSLTESLFSSSLTEPSFPAAQEDGPIQVAIENVPPQPSESGETVEVIADPLEPINRAFFNFNDKVYFWFFKPVATGYKAVVPEDGRIGVQNFFSNLTTPVRLINCLLQAKFKGAGNEAVRFLLNTTFGMAGFLDPAKKEFKIEKKEADFGQTLGIWGIGPAFYINWPILGPSTLRDTVGYVGDVFLDFRTYLPSRFLIVSISMWALDKVNETSLTIGEYESLKKAALDPYIALREAYYQYRQNKIEK